jgi:hypothetical protein
VPTNTFVLFLLPILYLSTNKPKNFRRGAVTKKMSERTFPSSPKSDGISTTEVVSTPRTVYGGDAGLLIRKQAPTHVFSGEAFEIEFGIEYNKGHAGSGRTAGDSDTEFVATLHHYKSGRLANDDAMLWMEPPSVWFSLRSSPPRKKQKVRCKIHSNRLRTPEQKVEAESYVIRLSPKEEATASLRGVQPVTSGSITLVNHKIKITPDEDFDSVWYKDEGGRDKCMTVVASLVDKNNVPSTGEKIPLQLTLCYASDPPFKVIKQDILRPLGPSYVCIDPASGRATVRFRIEDVSKNHQGQDFRIEVGPEAKMKGFKDISPGFTPAVSVRSKRNKRPRTASAVIKPEEGRFHSPTRPGSHGFPNIEEGARVEAPFAPDIPQLKEAITGVLQWADEVVNGLYPLQWQIIGYNQNPDGSPDYNRPYHNMPNPNAQISRVLSMYSESTCEHLRLLSSTVEQMDQPLGEPYHRPAEESFSGPPGPPPIQGMPPRGSFHNGPPPRAMHSAVPPEAFHDPGDMDPRLRYASPHLPPMRSPMPPMHHPMSRQRPRPPPPSTLGQPPMHHGHSLSHVPATMRSPPSPIQATPAQARLDDVSRESEVAYVLARHFKAMRTEERLGFPAYSATKEILGFYRESHLKVGVGHFIPISRHREDFGPLEIMQATEILEEAIATKSEAVHALKDWGNISNLLDHALVYDWSRGEIGSGSNTNGSSPGDGSHGDS